MRLDDHVTRELMKNPRATPPPKEGGDIYFFLPGHRGPFATWKDFDGVFGKQILTGAKSLTYDQRYILLPAAGVLISIPATNDRLVLRRFDLDDLLTKFIQPYLFVASSPVTVATRGSTYTYRVVVKTNGPGTKYQLDKAPPGMKVTTDGKITWEVPADFAADEAEVSLKVTDVRPLLAAVHTFRIAIEK
jgi:hypothetical protein